MTGARDGITRREVLRAAAGGAAAFGIAGIAGCGDDAPPPRERGRVIVVGAGLAGLSAAHALEGAGFEAVVLEARDRVGGRVHTLREPFAAGQHAEAGGEFVDTGHVRVRALADSLGLELEDLREQGEGEAIVARDGRVVPENEVLTPELEAELERFTSALDRIAGRLDPGDPLSDRSGADARAAADLLDTLSLDPLARALVERQLRDDYAADADALSLLFVAALEAVTAEQPDAGVEAYRIKGGNDQLARGLARSLARAVDHGAPVERIERRGRRVIAVVGGERVRGDALVLAAPLPALRGIAFAPALPDRLAEAIEHVGYGTVVKTMVQYRTRFWTPLGWSGDALADPGLPGSTWDATAGQDGRPGILMSYVSGSPAARIGAQDPSDIAAATTAAIDALSPDSLELALRGRSRAVRWRTDPYAGGTYAAFAPGQVTRYWRALRRPVGRIVLAGEHTDAYTGYMEGAIRSGLRAAQRIAG